jgi:hypothetical protein
MLAARKAITANSGRSNDDATDQTPRRARVSGGAKKFQIVCLVIVCSSFAFLGDCFRSENPRRAGADCGDLL